MRYRLAALIFGLLVTSGQTQAQAPAQRPAPQQALALSESAKAALGLWEFSNSERDRVCSLTLRSEPASGGFRVEFDTRCAGAFPLIKDVVGWRMADNELLRFLDASGKPVVEFSEVEGGMYEAPTPSYGVLFLQSASSVAPPSQNADQFAGEWSLQRGNRTVCDVTLTNNDIGDSAFALRLKPDCDASVTRFNPAAWRLDRGELVLANKNGDTWRFEEGENSVWRRIPVRSDGFALVKK